jgi:hypothetical protein
MLERNEGPLRPRDEMGAIGGEFLMTAPAHGLTSRLSFRLPVLVRSPVNFCRGRADREHARAASRSSKPT